MVKLRAICTARSVARAVASAAMAASTSIDRFKLINDSVGRNVGDMVLKEASQRLTTQLRDPDFVARLGSDEFAVLIEDAPDADSIVKIAQRVMSAIAAPMDVNGREIFVSISVGITLCDPRYPSSEDLLRNADAALYRAKQNGRQRFELFDEHLHHNALRVLEMDNALRMAIQKWQIKPVFQPVVSLEDGRIIGYEALMRWHHPERGVLAPGEFMQFAENNGCMEAIDWQIFEQAYDAFARIENFKGRLSVNVSPRHFHDRAFASRMISLMATTKMGKRSPANAVDRGVRGRAWPSGSRNHCAFRPVRMSIFLVVAVDKVAEVVFHQIQRWTFFCSFSSRFEIVEDFI